MKAERAKAGKPFSFAMLNKNGRLPQKLLVEGYDKYSAYDPAWQSYHLAAAAACRGSTPTEGSGPVETHVTSCLAIRFVAGLLIATVTKKFLSPGKAPRLHGMESSWAIFTTTLVAMQMTGDQRRPLLTMALCSSSFVVSAVAGGKKDSFCGIF